MTRPEMLESIALQISDGDKISWAHEDARGDAGVLANLRVLDTLTRTLRDQVSDPDVPEKWGTLQIVSQLGSGASADVFRARDSVLQRDVALKLFRSRDPDLQQRLLDEGRLMAKLRHPNIVQVFGVEQHEGRIGLWMELIEGQNLDELVESDGPLSAAETVLIGQQLCSALAAVHQAGLLFRDIKAQNVIRERGGNLKLTDFGSGIRSSDITTKRISGTPYYLAPELLDGVAASPQSDIYALGVLLYRLSTGQFPVEADTVDDLVTAHQQGPRHLLDVRADLPAGFVTTIEKAIATDPAARFKTPGALAAALEHSEKGAGISRRHVFGAIALVAIAAAVTMLTLPAHYSFESNLYRLNADQSRTALTSGDSISVGDNLVLEITASKPLYVYVFNEDTQGRAWGLFPLAAAGHELPLAAGATHFLPATNDDNLSWTVDSVGGIERIHVLASTEPMPELAIRFSELPAAGMRATGFDRRGIGSLSRNPGLANPSASAMIQAAQSLAGTAETDSGVSYRVIELANSGR
jgi:serine/threonine protein kinase